MTENRANVDVARTQNNYAIQNLAEVLGEVEVWKKEVNSRVASTQALISISCQLDRIANALEAQSQKPVRVQLDGRDFEGHVQRAEQDRRIR